MGDPLLPILHYHSPQTISWFGMSQIAVCHAGIEYVDQYSDILYDLLGIESFK